MENIIKEIDLFTKFIKLIDFKQLENYLWAANNTMIKGNLMFSAGLPAPQQLKTTTDMYEMFKEAKDSNFSNLLKPYSLFIDKFGIIKLFLEHER